MTELTNLAKLPARVYTTLLSNPREVIMIKRSEKGYYSVETCKTAEEAEVLAERLNALLVPAPTKAVIMAMQVGSMFGWEVPGADPATYSNL